MTNNMRSVKEVATAALNDVNLVLGTQNGKFYGYETIVSGLTGYSRYNAAQQAVLAEYAGVALKSEE